MTEIWFAAVEKFGPWGGGSWQKYMEFSGLPQLREVVSLDCSLCPNVISDLGDEDWKSEIIHRGGYLGYHFKDLDDLCRAVPTDISRQILAVSLEPETSGEDALRDNRFRFMGFDLIDEGSGMSSLVNHGEMPLAFDKSELSEVGLVSGYNRAREIQLAMEANYPNDEHAYCDLWVIWRMIED